MRRLHTGFAAALVAAFAVACSDSTKQASLTDPSSPRAVRAELVPGTCTTYPALVALVDSVFGTGTPNARSALGKLDNLQKQYLKGPAGYADMQAQANNIVSFITVKATENGFLGTHLQVQTLISNVLCYAGLIPNTFMSFPADTTQVFTEPSGEAGVQLPPDPHGTPKTIKIEVLDHGIDADSLLDTKLDKYPGYIHITSSSALDHPVTVAVCPTGNVPAEVRERLRLGHQGTAGFEITPEADASFLDCENTVAANKRSLLNRLASLFMPKPLYAKMFAGGGVGGLASEFSPFGPVDTQLSFSGGVGGTATEFAPKVRIDALTDEISRPKSFSKKFATSVVAAGAPSGACEAVVGTPVSVECRPTVTLTTHNGTILTGVPVDWAVGLGEGVIAAQALAESSCSAFGGSAATSTDASGKASVCWTVGSTVGTNTVVATPRPGGDAPAGVSFDHPSVTFTAMAMRMTPVATASGEISIFDTHEHPGSGACSPSSLTPVLTYDGDGSVPVNAGSRTLTVTCGAGSASYYTVSATALIEIAPAPVIVAVSCPASVPYTAERQGPCTATATGPGLSGSADVTYAPTPVRGAGSYSATTDFPTGGNYLGGTDTKSFTITKAPATATAGSGAMLYGGTVPSMPCALTGILAPDAGTVTCTTATPSLAPGNNATTPTVSPANPANYAMTLVNGTLAVRYVQVGCFASPIYSSLPPTKSAQKKGSNLPIKCTLQNALGAPVTVATGGIQVYDMGITGASAPILAFSKPNAFVGSSGNYAYGLETATLIIGHYYRVVASWNDLSTTTGYFLLK